MEDYPKALLEFADRFSTENKCREYLINIRWPSGFKCSRCGNPKGWSTNRDLFHCSNCGFQTSIRSGTIFHGSRRPLRLWFHAMWHITSQKYGTNALGLQRELGLGSYHTAWEWLHKLRRAMVRPGRDKLYGLVEVDETYIGGKKAGKRGRGAGGKDLVLIAVEVKGKKLGRIRLQRVIDASASNLIPFVKTSIETGSTVQTDGWRGYNQLKTEGYTHNMIQETASAGDKDEDILPHVHLVVSLFKRWMLGTYQGAIKSSHLDYYLDEYTFRFNRRTSKSRGKLFFRLIEQAIVIDPISGKDI